MARRPPPQPLDELQRYSIDETLQYLRTSRGKLYQRIATGELRTITEGKRRYVPGTEIARLSRVA